MSKRRLVATTKIIWDAEWEEYIVRAWDQNGRRFEGADYHTTDKDDAQATAQAMKLSYLNSKDQDA